MGLMRPGAVSSDTKQKGANKMPWKDVPLCPKCGGKPNYVKSHTEGRYWIFYCAKYDHRYKRLQRRFLKHTPSAKK